jgi:hypothetical protein
MGVDRCLFGRSHCKPAPPGLEREAERGAEEPGEQRVAAEPQ